MIQTKEEYLDTNNESNVNDFIKGFMVARNMDEIKIVREYLGLLLINLSNGEKVSRQDLEGHMDREIEDYIQRVREKR